MTASVPSFYFDRLYLLQDDVLQARILDSASQNDWAAIRWIAPPDPAQFVRDLQALAESHILNP